MTALSSEEVRRFRDQGYLVVRGVLDPHTDFPPLVDEYTQVLNDLAREWQAQGEVVSKLPGPAFLEHLYELCAQPSFPRHRLAELDITLPHFPFSVIREDSRVHAGPAVFGLLRNPKLLDVVESVLGPEICSSPNQHCRLKLPKRLIEAKEFGAQRGETLYAPTMWHQDMHTQMPQSDDTEVLTVWIAMGSVTEAHGCLLVRPGGHKEGLLPWPMNDELRAELSRSSVALPAEAGDVILLDKRTPHAARTNEQDSIRWSMDFRYFPADKPSDRPWFPNFVARSRSNPERELRDPAQWARMWHDARVNLARRAQPLPGRKEFAHLVATALIKRWQEEPHATAAP
jgi:phytanoyl-CoA hydroxylase